MNKLIPTLLIVLIFTTGALGVIALQKPSVVERVTEKLGSLASPDVYSYLNVHGVFTQGGSYTSISTTSATYTLDDSEMDDENVIVIASTAYGAALTLTLPATSTLTSILPDVGSYRTWVIENAHTAAATTTTIAAGTGIDLQIPESTGADAIININNYGWLTCFKEASTNVVCRLDETIPGD